MRLSLGLKLGSSRERSATNQALWSEAFDNAVWNKLNITVTANAIAAPNGTTTADKIEATAAAATNINQAITWAGGASVGATYSLYVKQGSGATQAHGFAFVRATGTTVIANLNFSTGGISYIVGSNEASAQDVGGGWWRIRITIPDTIADGNTLTIYPGFWGDSEGAGEFNYSWGAQLEAGLNATSYIPTTTDPVTRA